ncbi:hypothetical protein FS837_009767 [Tulasnella sp. UAMH 9824]|nr:hypothetical protein FS837_009767 [Tulasnella sp. UAMH 9824]
MARDRTINVPPASAPAPSGILKVSGKELVGEDGKPVILRGAGLGGHLNMENFITGYPGHEKFMRKALKNVLGEEKYDYFFDKFLEYFFTEKDAQFFASLGFNCIRIPLNYRHIEDDANPGVFLERGFQWLDRVINLCAAEGIYTIIDLHAAPGGQNGDWHCDTGIHMAFFWEYVEFQNRTIAIWEELARRYKGNTWVAGFNPLNEPCDEEHYRLLAFYERVEKAIRAIDPDHILFWDGNTFAADFSKFGDPLPNSVYAIHDYSNFGFPSSPEPYKGTPEQKGMVYVSPDTAYIKRLKPFLDKKKRLAADEWGCDVSTVDHIFKPVDNWLLEEVPGIKKRYPPMWNVTTHVGRLLRNILLSEELYPEYAAYFQDLSFEDLEEMAASFKFENCVQRQGLNDAIKPKA